MLSLARKSTKVPKTKKTRKDLDWKEGRWIQPHCLRSGPVSSSGTINSCSFIWGKSSLSSLRPLSCTCRLKKHGIGHKIEGAKQQRNIPRSSLGAEARPSVYSPSLLIALLWFSYEGKPNGTQKCGIRISLPSPFVSIRLCAVAWCSLVANLNVFYCQAFRI